MGTTKPIRSTPGTLRFWLHDATDKHGKRPINIIYSTQGQGKYSVHRSNFLKTTGHSQRSRQFI